jgi:hypothetical protein
MFDADPLVLLPERELILALFRLRTRGPTGAEFRSRVPDVTPLRVGVKRFAQALLMTPGPIGRPNSPWRPRVRVVQQPKQDAQAYALIVGSGAWIRRHPVNLKVSDSQVGGPGTSLPRPFGVGLRTLAGVRAGQACRRCPGLRRGGQVGELGCQ